MSDTARSGQEDVTGNWGRWGPDDQLGTLNLIDDRKRAEAAGLVRSGRTVSLSRDISSAPRPDIPQPFEQRLTMDFDKPTGWATEEWRISPHGHGYTHIDGLSHVFDRDRGMWLGRDPKQELHESGARWGAINNWASGIVTRCVLLDIPRLRGVPYVDLSAPVTAAELEDAEKAQGVVVTQGDAVAVRSGREAWETVNGGGYPTGRGKPGLDGICTAFLQERDVSVLLWDMGEASGPFGTPEHRLTVHNAIWSLGLAIVDNCSLAELAQECDRQARWEFMVVVLPLRIAGGTGSPANPVAIF